MNSVIKRIILSVVAVLLFISGFFLLKGDYVPFLRWWATQAYIGIIFIPISAVLFSGFNDKGYLFSKAIGIAAVAYIMWLLSSLHIMKFTPASCIISVVIGLYINVTVLILILRKRKKEQNTGISYSFLKDNVIDRILTEEVLFFALFLLFTYIRGFKPEAYGTEKPMDYGFMTSMIRNDYMPPTDLWFSGGTINYYYVGQYIATFLTKLSFVKVSSGYNIMLMMVGALAVVLPYSLVNNMTRHFLKQREKNNRDIPHICGALAGIGVCLAGNMHYPTFRWLEPAVRKFFGITANTKKYWFPDATRFIGYHPETHDKTIHEFPCYSFVLGDLHAHVINIMFVLTVLGLLFAWLCKRKEHKNLEIPWWKEVFSPQIIAISFFIGLFHTTNYWDFPIYFIVSGAIILFTNLIVYNFRGKALGVTALQGVLVIVLSELVSLPFTLRFDQISTGLKISFAHTPLNQMIILWGLPIFTVIAFICFMIANFIRKRRRDHSLGQKNSLPGLLAFMENLTDTDLFIITIGLCAIGLVLMPEVIYIQDIYNGDYKRANTMFKLTYQAFIMFGICFGYIFVRLLIYGETKRQRKVAVTGLVLFLFSSYYVQNAVGAWYGNIFNINGYKGLDCTAFMSTSTNYQDDVEAINWLNEHIKGTPVVLEANGDSYSDYERVSVMTGLPTVLGWRTHEWLWRSDPDTLDVRAEDIKTIYTSANAKAVRELIEEYHISYIYVGKLEQDKFTNMNHSFIKKLGEVVYSSPALHDKNYETYIVKVQE